MQDFEEKGLTATQTNLIAVEGQRAMMQVQGAIVSAKKFPRDEFQARKRILDACKRPLIADQSQYEYPRQGTNISGPSIRLAEVMARYWGNLDYGIRELSQSDGESMMESYCWDLETNVRVARNFVVKHSRKAKGEIKSLEDPRDIYELTANMGSRRLRACIMEIIPSDIQEEAIDECNKTMAGKNTEPLAVRLQKMLEYLENFDVTKAIVEATIGHNIEAVTEHEFVSLRKKCASIKDGIGKPADFFKFPAEATRSVPAESKPIVAAAQAVAERKPAGANPAPEMPPAAPQNGSATITDEDVQDLLELLTESEIPLKDWRGYLDKEFGIENLESLPKNDLQHFRNWITSETLKIKQAKEAAAERSGEPSPKEKEMAVIDEFMGQMTPEQNLSFQKDIANVTGGKSLQTGTFSNLKVLKSMAADIVNSKKPDTKPAPADPDKKSCSFTL